ncbi:hypothetical protein PHLGIDRAFT_117819, partial [Phlebiopsis gigantea 11061_1 CR5-6]
QFIVSCPETNAQLPVNPLPKLTIAPGSPAPGDSVSFTFDASQVRKDGSQLYVAWFDGVALQYSDLSADSKATVPADLQGTVYAAVVKDKSSAPTSQGLSTGLVMFEVAVPSYATNL